MCLSCMIPKLVGQGGVAPPTQSVGVFDSSETVLCRQSLSWVATALRMSASKPHFQAPQSRISPVLPVKCPSMRDTNCWLAWAVKSFQVGIDTRSATNWLAAAFSGRGSR